MPLFHRHKWQIAGVSFSEPTSIRESITLNGKIADELPAILRRATEGVTHVYLRCEGCGDLKERDFYGKFTPQGDDTELEQLRKMVNL